MDEDLDLSAAEVTQADDLLDDPSSLPDVAPPFNSHKYTRLFAVDVGGPGQDQYVYIVPNGLCVVGLAPSHVLLKDLRQASKPSQPLKPANAPQPPPETQQTQTAEAATVSQPSIPSQHQPEQAATEPASAPSPQVQDATTQAVDGHEPKAGDKRTAPSEPSNGSPAHPPSTSSQPDGRPAKQQAVCSLESSLKVNFDIGKRDMSLKQSGKKRNQGTILEGNTVLCHIEAPGQPRLLARVVAGGKLLEVNQRLSKQPELVLTRPCREGYLAILFPTDNQLAGLRRSLMSCEDYLKLRGLTEADLA